MLKFAIPESDKDDSCYTELSEKCNKVIEMQNNFDQIYSHSNVPPLDHAVEEDNCKPYVHEDDQMLSLNICSENLLRSRSSSNPVSQNIPAGVVNERPPPNSQANELQGYNRNGLFFARPINVCSDYDYDYVAQDTNCIESVSADSVENASRYL